MVVEMTTDRVQTVLRAIADVPSETSPSLIDQVCAAAVKVLSLRGSGVSLMVGGELRGRAGVSDAGISEIQELQLELGEGPGVDAWASGAAVSEPDIAHPKVVRWPAFAEAAERAGVVAVYAFPMRMGAIRIGVLVFYRDRVGELSAEEAAYGLVFADVATHMVLGLQAGAPADELHEVLADEPPHWAEIHQATGMVSVQLDVALSEAFVRLRAHAFASGRSLRAVSRDILHGRLRLANSL
jgi:ABC-type tungstate transport system substrate-binding protein